MTDVAVLGTGNMGTPIARRLPAAGHQVTAWNRTAARAAPLSGDGARVASAPARAADGADVVITMLTDVTAVQAVLFGAPSGNGSTQNDVTAALRPGVRQAQMSATSPDEVRALAEPLITALAALRDTLLAADAAGADRAAALEVLSAGPRGGAAKRATAPGASFAIALAAKDARIALRGADGAVVAAAAARILSAAPDQEADVATLTSKEPR